jgi:hypothetical protein
MTAPRPHVGEWTAHASAKAQLIGLSRTEIEDAILTRHAERTSNTRSADWLLAHGSLRIAYNHPSAGDATIAKVVTLWRT